MRKTTPRRNPMSQTCTLLSIFWYLLPYPDHPEHKAQVESGGVFPCRHDSVLPIIAEKGRSFPPVGRLDQGEAAFTRWRQVMIISVFLYVERQWLRILTEMGELTCLVVGCIVSPWREGPTLPLLIWLLVWIDDIISGDFIPLKKSYEIAAFYKIVESIASHLD